MLGDEAHTPGQRLTAAAGHAAVDECVEHLTLLDAQPSHRRRAHVGEPGGEVAAPGAPADLAPEAGLGPFGDLDPLLPGGLTEPDDLLLGVETGARAAQVAGDDDLVGVVEHHRLGHEPVGGYGIGEPLVELGGRHRRRGGGCPWNTDHGTTL